MIVLKIASNIVPIWARWGDLTSGLRGSIPASIMFETREMVLFHSVPLAGVVLITKNIISNLHQT